jgi:hypothetical protein
MTLFGVITEVPDDYSGNYACGELLVVPGGRSNHAGSNLIVDPHKFDEDLFVEALRSQGKSTTIDLTKKQMLFCNVPVFRLGEIMVIDTCGRTIPDGRKPDKWDVGCEYFEDIESAIERSEEVTR